MLFRLSTISNAGPSVQLVPLNSFDRAASLEAFWHSPNDNELEQHRRLRLNRRRELFARAHGAMRLAISQFASLEPHELRFQMTPLGKPVVPGGPWFSLSYAGDEAWLALSREQPVGLDVVLLGGTSVPLTQDLISSADLSAIGELATVSGRPDLIAWAAKESVAKLTGDVRREPREWRLQRDTCLFVDTPDHGRVDIDVLAASSHLVAAIARPSLNRS